MFAAADLADLLVHELASLGARRFPRPLVLASLRDCALLRHHHSPLRPFRSATPSREGPSRSPARCRLCCQRLCYQFDPSAPRPDEAGRSHREKALARSRHSTDPVDGPVADARREMQMNILTVNLLFSTLVFAIAAKLYLIPMLPRLEPRSVVLPILLLHGMRHLGLMFLAPGGVFPGMPEEFAYPATIGDLIAAMLALIALAADSR